MGREPVSNGRYADSVDAGERSKFFSYTTTPDEA